MGASDSKLDLEEYDVNKLADLGTFLFLGPNIQTALWQFLNLKKHIPQAVVMASPELEDEYQQIVSDVYIYTSYSSDLAHKIITRQLKLGNKMGPVLMVIEHDRTHLPVDRLYKTDKNFRQLIDYAKQLRLCLALVMREPAYIPLRRQLPRNSMSSKSSPRMDYIIVSRKKGLQQDTIDDEYTRKLYKFYFRSFLPDDENTFHDTLAYYTNDEHVLVLVKDQDLYYYKPDNPTEPFHIGIEVEEEEEKTETDIKQVE